MGTEKLWNPQYIALMIANIFASFGFYMVNTMLVAYLTGEAVGITSAAAGVIAGMFSITALISRPFCGIMADRFNKTWLLRVATLFMAAGAFGYGLSKAVPLIVLARILHGVGFAINTTTLISLVTQYVPQRKLGEGLGYFGLTNVIASATAPGFGVSAADWLGTGSVFWIAGLMCIGEILLLFIVQYPDTGGTVSDKKAAISIKDIIAVEVLGYTCISSMFSFSNGIVTSYLVLYGKELGIENISLYFTVNALAMFLIRPVAGKLMDKKGMYIVAFPGMAAAIASMFLLASAGKFTGSVYTVIIVSSVLKALGQGAAQPSLQAASIKKAGKERSGSATSTYYLGGDIGQGVAPMIAGVVVGNASAPLKGYVTSFQMTGILLICAMTGLIFIYCREKSKL